MVTMSESHADRADAAATSCRRAKGNYRARMLYRIRRYAAVPERLAAFNDFFSGYLLPIQVRHGARLVGRWEAADQIEAKVRRGRVTPDQTPPQI